MQHLSQRSRDWVLALLLLAVTLAAYLPSINGTPIWDDDVHITRPELRSIEGLGRIWTHLGDTPQYYPLAHSFFWGAYRVWGSSPIGYHILNILLHVLSALLLIRLLRKLDIGGAWLAGGIFALHPVMVESVAWITELKNTLSGVFLLSAALMYLKFDQERKGKLYGIAFCFFIFGLLSKSVIATLPVSLLVVFWWKRGQIRWKQDVVPLIPFFLTGISTGLFTAYVEQKFVGAEGSVFDISFIERCLIAGRAMWFYLSKLFLPIDLVFIYPRWSVNQAVWWQYLFPVAAVLLAAVLWSMRKRSRTLLAVFLYFTATLFPALGFLNVYPFQFSFVADHFQYLAAIGPIVIAAGVVDRMLGTLKEGYWFLKPSVAAILLLTLGILTWRQNELYTNAETLYRTTILKNPSCWMAHNNLGIVLSQRGRIKEAVDHYYKALEFNQNFASAHYNLANALRQTGQTDEAIVHFQKALDIYPNDAKCHFNLGNALMQAGRHSEGIDHYRKSLAINPSRNRGHLEVSFNFACALMLAGQSDEAITQFKEVLEMSPTDLTVLKYLRDVLLQTGRRSEAIEVVKRALDAARSRGEESLARGIEADLKNLCRTEEKTPEQKK